MLRSAVVAAAGAVMLAVDDNRAVIIRGNDVRVLVICHWIDDGN